MDWNKSKERINAMDKLKNEFLKFIFDGHGQIGSDIYKVKELSVGQIRDELYAIFKALMREELEL